MIDYYLSDYMKKENLTVNGYFHSNRYFLSDYDLVDNPALSLETTFPMMFPGM